MSFNPGTRLPLHLRAAAGAARSKAASRPEFKAGTQFYGSPFAPASDALPGRSPRSTRRRTGSSGRSSSADSCYSGSATTAGNLIFVGRNDGHLQAYDARNGQLLWSFQTGAGANNTASVFDLDGKQVVAFYAAGSALGRQCTRRRRMALRPRRQGRPGAGGLARAAPVKHAGEKKATKTAKKAPAAAATVNVSG